ncbi:MAG: MATE family efflux transporter [Lachnospiraceae bacterium]|nr:MATE family efflux transporter [Robinsoniella sp.]MDY3766042.1 MATE family efflux transporter [Lachnospiraceae bacterium]
MDQTFMKKKPIFQLIVSMSLPMILSMMVSSLYNIIDSFFVAKISEKAMTALSLVYPVQNLINAVIIGFGVGMNAVISFYLGGQNSEKAESAASHGTFLNLCHGLVLTILGIAAMPSFLAAFTSDQETLAFGLNYANLVFSFSILSALGLSFEKLFQAVGKMKISMLSMISGCVANIVLDPILIFGFGFVPEMGIQGAAIATVLGQVLTLAVYLVFYFVDPLPVKIRAKHFHFDPAMARKLYSIGIPSTLNLALPSVLISTLNAILSAYSQVYVLVLGIYYKLQTFLYLSANGLIQGIRPLIGYNYGAKEYHRVKKIYTTTLLMTIVIMCLGTGLCTLFPERLISLFTDNTETIEIGSTALRIISTGFAVSSVSIVSCGALEGLGMGMPSLIISLCRYLIIMLPAAFLLSHFIGVTGVWHAFWVTELFAAVISWSVYRNMTAHDKMMVSTAEH